MTKVYSLAEKKRPSSVDEFPWTSVTVGYAIETIQTLLGTRKHIPYLEDHPS